MGARFQRLLAVGIGACALLGAAPAARALDIVLNAGPLLLADPGALAAFERATQVWESLITTPVRVNINAEMTDDPDPTVIGSTSIFTAPVNLPYTIVRDALAARASRVGSEILAYLPTSSQINASVPTATGATFDTTTLGITRANQKAIGLIENAAADAEPDAVINFNKNFTFDYDSRNGVDNDKIDFQTAAIHEIGHVLGFLSDTDDYDQFPDILDNATTLDLFRFAAGALPRTAEEFTHFPRELRPGIEASFTDTQIAIAMSTGQLTGDSRQASHWKDDFIFDLRTGTIYFGEYIGIMDPTLPSGIFEQITGADLRALELIGWDTVPEPMSFLFVASASAVTMLRRRRCGL